MSERMSPVVIFDESGAVRDAGIMNEKAHAKSLENNTIWLFHPETGRVLPYGDAGLRSLKVVGSRYEATVNTAHLPEGTPALSSAKESVRSGNVAETAPGTTANAARGPADPTRLGSIITELAGIVEDRRRTMPEGSYTTHLFTQGPDKIRKKTGEEAVELILARDEAEIVYEAADLVYHVLVLFAALGIPITKVFDELASRAK